jgi:hypothetical protein
MSTQSTQDWSWLNNLFNVGAQVGSVYGALEAADDVKTLGNTLYSDLTSMGDAAMKNSEFQGYGLQSSLGNTAIDGQGNVDFGVGQDSYYQSQAQNYGGASMDMMRQSMMDPYQRQQEIYNQMMAVQNPLLNQQQAQQQAREYAMGRGGVRGSAFGGTAEDAAMARARAQASNEAAFAARNQGLAEQLQQANMATAFGNMGMDAYNTSYLPIHQQAALWQLAGGDADRAQTGQLTGIGYDTQLGLGGAGVNVNAQNVASQMKAQLYDSILDNIGGNQGAAGDAVSGIAGLFSTILGLGG